MRTQNVKASVPKNLFRLLWLLFAVFILYGTTIPFTFSLDPKYLHSRFAQIEWYPLVSKPGDHHSLTDYVQNILLFLPFGFLGYFAVAEKRSRWKPFAVIVLGSLLSACVEFLQLFSETRVTALTDWIWNTVGTVGGVGAGILSRGMLRNLRARPSLRKFLEAEYAYPALMFGLIVVVGFWEPFDFTLDVGSVLPKLREVLAHPFALDPSPDDILAFTRFAFFAYFACRLCRQVRPGSEYWGALCACALGNFLEFSQFIVASRMPEFNDALVLTAGVLLGFGCSYLPYFHRHRIAWGIAFLGGYGAAIVFKDVFPLKWSPVSGGFNWMPFLPYFQNTSFLSLSDFIEQIMTYFCLGVIPAYLSGGRRVVFLATLVFAFLVSAGIEDVQRFLPAHTADITDILGALVGVTISQFAITRGGSLYREYIRPHTQS